MYAYARGWHDFSKKQFPVVTSHGQQWEDNTRTTHTSQKKVYYIKRERIFKGVRTYYQNRSKFPLFLLFYIITFFQFVITVLFICLYLFFYSQFYIRIVLLNIVLKSLEPIFLPCISVSLFDK